MTSQTVTVEEKTISIHGDTWRVIGRGVTNEAGETYCHLASTTRFRQQRNGACPIQAGVWVPAEVLQ